MAEYTEHALIIKDQFSPLERQYITLFEQWCEMADGDEKDEISDTLDYLAEVLQICDFVPENNLK